MGVGTVTVAMAGAAVSSSDFSSSILGTPGASEDKSFKIFLAKTVCCRDFNKNWGRKVVYLMHSAGETVKCSKPARKVWVENENYTLSSNSYWRGLFKMPSTDGQGSQHRTAVLVKTHDTAITTFPFSSEHASLNHFYLFPAFSYIKSQNLSPHLHWGNRSISKTTNTSARELSTKGVSRNACREPAVHNLTPAWETIPSVWEQSRSYVHRCPAWENSWVKERTDCFIISMN